MADSTQDAASGYIDAVKWIVGISGALLAGVFLHPELTAEWPKWGRNTAALALFLLGTSIYGGVVYLLWLNWNRRRIEAIAQIDKELMAPVVIPDAERAKELTAEKAELMKYEKETKTLQKRWYGVFLGTFLLGGALGVIIFCVEIAQGQKPKDDKKDCRVTCCVDKSAVAPDSKRFTVVQSAMHKTQHGMQAHTFLLDEKTGGIWQMICDQKGAVVAFQRVKRLDLNGNPEMDTNGSGNVREGTGR